MSLIVRLPWPDPNLMPNRKNGKHWTSTARVKTEQKEASYLCTKAAIQTADHQGFGDGNIPLSLVYMPKDNRHRDLDNLLASSKALIDGMAEALGVNDRRFKPILVDVVSCGGDGCVVAAVGVTIVSGVSL